MKEVVVVQHRLDHYRLQFYDLLRRNLRQADTNLRLIYGPKPIEPELGEDINHLYGHLDWAEPLASVTSRHGFTWQPYLRSVMSADLLITEHAAKHVLNFGYFLLPFRPGPKLAFWGHGWHHQASNPNSLTEQFKTAIGKRAHHYFAYTWKIRDRLIELGYDPMRVTDIQNSISAPEKLATPEQVTALRREFGIPEDAKIGLFCGAIYGLRRIPRLVEIAGQLRRRLPNFHLIIAGAGPDQRLAETAAAASDFIHFAGPVLGLRKSALFAMSDAAIMPGVIGLGVVDAFQHGLPVCTAQNKFHGPEFAYLKHDINALIAPDQTAAMVDDLEALLTNDQLRARLTHGARQSAAQLTIEEMAHRFTDGIGRALSVPAPMTAAAITSPP